MYYVVLFAHSWTRWAVLISCLVSLLLLLHGLIGAGPRGKIERFSQGAFIGFLDLQFCLGLTLLFLSPLISWPHLHPWIYQHVGGMLAAMFVLHAGPNIAKKSKTPQQLRRKLLIANGLGVVIILSSIPWPGFPFSRPLMRIWE